VHFTLDETLWSRTLETPPVVKKCCVYSFVLLIFAFRLCAFDLRFWLFAVVHSWEPRAPVLEAQRSSGATFDPLEGEVGASSVVIEAETVPKAVDTMRDVVAERCGVKPVECPLNT
jgi:predicted AlkP superfamily pyrophosphatase or phosphodiesterase